MAFVTLGVDPILGSELCVGRRVYGEGLYEAVCAWPDWTDSETHLCDSLYPFSLDSRIRQHGHRNSCMQDHRSESVV
jgi:hypothetical protein